MTPDGARLDTLWRAVLSEPVTSRFRTTATGVVTSHGPVLVAVRDDDVPHLLVPIDGGHRLNEDLDGQAVTLRRRILEDADTYRTYAALALVDGRLRDLFRALCVELLKRIDAAPDRAATALRRTLADWRSLLSGARRTLGPAELSGLFGELLLLREMIDVDPGSVAFWTGHSGTAQDFHRGTAALEVKATTAPEGRQVRIHGVGQLEGGHSGRLWLAWLRLRTDQGRSVPELVDEIRDVCDDEPGFLTALRNAGYLVADREVYAHRPFDVVERRTYEVGPGFPRITVAGLTGDATLAGIAGIHYDLDLDGAPAADALVDLDPARAFLEYS